MCGYVLVSTVAADALVLLPQAISIHQHQAIIWTNDGILLIQTWGTNFSEILSEIHTFSFKKMHLKMSCGIRRPFCLSLNVLKSSQITATHLQMSYWDLTTIQKIFCMDSQRPSWPLVESPFVNYYIDIYVPLHPITESKNDNMAHSSAFWQSYHCCNTLQYIMIPHTAHHWQRWNEDQYKDGLSQVWDSHVKDKRVMRPYYL